MSNEIILNEFTLEEISKHNTMKDCWIILGSISTEGEKVYDITNYLNDHPGGPEVLLEYAGKNAENIFQDIGHSDQAKKLVETFLIGKVKVFLLISY